MSEEKLDDGMTLKQYLKQRWSKETMVETKIEKDETTKEEVVSPESLKNMRTKQLSLLAFLTPPVIISIISIIHLYDFFLITNSPSMAFSIAFSFELVSISSLIALTVLDKINAGALWTVFWLVALYQIIGNVHASFVAIDDSLFKKFVEMFWMVDSVNSRRLIAIIQGAALPIISLSLIKLAVDYMDYELMYGKWDVKKKR